MGMSACGRLNFDLSDPDSALACTPGTVTARRTLTDCTFGCHGPKIAWAGDRYMMCWTQETTPDASGPTDLMCAPLDRDGSMLAEPVELAVLGSPVAMSLSWTGSDFLFSYASNPTGDYEVYTQRFDMDVVAQPPTRVTTASGTGWGTSSVWTGTQIGVAYYDYRGGGTAFPAIFFARVDAAGASGETPLTSQMYRAFGTSLVWTGTEFVVAWRDLRDSGTWDIYMQRLDAAGTAIGAPITVTDDSTQSEGANLEWTGSALAIAYTKGGTDGVDDAYFAMFDATGAPLVPELQLTNAPNTQRSVQLVELGDAGFVVAWFDARTGTEELYLRRLEASGMDVGSDLVVAGAPYYPGAAPNDPAIAKSDRGLGTTWAIGGTADAEVVFVEMCP